MAFSALAQAAAGPLSVDAILQFREAPPGVVFEIIEPSPEQLAPALFQAQTDAARLRDKFPKLPIAIVSHGREQFALLRENANRFEAAHRASHALIDSGVEISVCGVNAERRGKTAEDFMQEIDVSAEGPARIRDLEALGYLRVRVRSAKP
ncbi:MAG: DsrE family protein [Gammaproteobacteria bacterium]|nr:DsrE family protein [Gammaproteobacteria bacterium]MCP5135591.1 DsrE family protein [Gammaproteobacteria bacterium]